MKKITSCLVLAFCLCIPKVWSAAADESIYRQVLFNMGDEGSQYWRIPALTVAKDGSLVAVADARGTSLGDLPNIITLMSRRSTDGGRTWSDPVVVAQGNSATGKTYGDAAVITERETGKIICMYVGDKGLWTATPYDRQGIYYSESTDNGQSWSQPISITNQVYANHSSWYAGFAGSGRGLQLESGRLIYVLAVRPNSTVGGTLQNWAIYSDDKGATWTVSDNYATTLGDEAKSVELGDGTVLMSIRNPNKGYRLFSKSTNKGKTWSTATASTTLADAACNGDIMRIEYNGKNYLVHSLPKSSTTRENVSLFVSADEGESWRFAKQLVNGYSAYSSMVELPDDSIAVLVEEGKWDSNLAGEDGFTLVLYKFSKDWLFENIDTESGGGDELAGTLPLNGTDQYMRIPYAAELHPQRSNGGYTVTFKAKVADAQSAVGFFVSTRYYEGTNNNNTVGYDLVSNGSNQYGMNLSLSSGAWGKGNSGYQNYASGSWHHFSWVYDMTNGTSKLYIDGVEKNSKTLAEYKTGNANNERDILVGAGYTTNVANVAAALGNYLNGEIDDLHFYQKTLSSTEISADMTSFDLTTAKSNLALKAAYNFEGITTTTVPDITGNGHDATLINYNPAAKTYLVNVTANGATYTLQANGEAVNESSVPAGSELTLTVTPPKGKEVSNVTWNGENCEGSDNVYTFTVNQAGTLVINLVNAQDPNSYCVFGYAETSQAVGQRYLRSITWNNETQNTSFTISNIENSTTHSMYHDFSETEIFEAAAGDVIQPSVNHASGGEWIHCYFYIDYNQDKKFSDGNTDQSDVYYPFYFDGNKPQEGSELVSFPFYSPDESGSGYNSKGATSDNNPWFVKSGTNKIPSFQLPANLKSGDYRVRFNITWNELDPCAELWAPQNGNATAIDNRMDQVGGSMTDFTLRITGSETVAVDEVVAESVKVYGVDGEVVVESQTLATVQIYATSGELVVAPFQAIGIKAVNVPAGMYIVKVDNVAKLVVVK